MNLATAIALAALCVSILTYVRAGRWKEGEDAKKLVSDVSAIDRRLTTVEAEIKGLATKADIAGLIGRLDGLKDLVERAEAAVERVEQHLMRAS